MDNIAEKVNSIMESNISSIYIVHCEETGLYKIGMSNRTISRIRELAGASAYKITPVQGFRVYEPFARPFEKLLHKTFAHCRTHGEWFKLSEAEIKWIAMHPCPSSVNLITSGPMVERRSFLEMGKS